jgi:6,7-dimethyl-8-ribityllumazine synthase
MPKVHEGGFDASGLRFALVVTRFNNFVTQKLEEGAVDALVRHGAKDDDIEVFRVPGSFELPQVVQKVVATGRFDGVVALGCLIRGGTLHFDLLAAETTKGLAQIAMQAGVPLTFGVLTTDTIEQAIERSGTKQGNKGFDSAMACIELVRLSRAVSAKG